MVDSAHRHIQLCCHLKDGTDVWLRESTVQKASNAAVCTYWGCGPGEEWKRPGTESVLGSISPEPLKLMAYRKNAAEVRLQMVGSPASQEQWMSVEDVKAQWPTFYEENCAHAPSSPSAQTTMHIQGPGSEERDLQTIVGHRLQEDDEGGGSQFQLSCQWDSGPETWEDEVKIQSVWNAAVLTYWNSEPGLRTLQAEGKVPHRYLRIQSHDEPNRTMEVQWLGYSACADETSWESFSKVKEKWSSAFESYVKLHSLESLLDS
ncbi:hypothetical protein MY4038_010357 [Beauveria bassiana]